jgi:hypothetical protein
MPEGMSRPDLLDLMARLTVHMDEELRGHACQSMQTLTHDFPEWRHEVLQGYIAFIVKEVADTHHQLVDHGLRMVLQLVTTWKNAVLGLTASTTPNSSLNKEKDRNKSKDPEAQKVKDQALIEQHIAALHVVEGFAVVMLCNVRPVPRKLAVGILREVKLLGKNLSKFLSHLLPLSMYT